MTSTYVTDWREDPQGNVYRCCHSLEVLYNYWVEYKPQEPKFPLTPFKHFMVEVRERVWSVWAKDTESAALPFWSEISSTYPKRAEVEVTEVPYGEVCE